MPRKNRSAKSMEDDNSVIYWWPDSVFSEVQWKKDPGSIPLELKKLGYRVTLVVGKFASKVKHNEIDVIETYSGRRAKPTFNLFERLMGIKVVLELAYRSRPKSIIIEQSPREILLFLFLLRLRIIIRPLPKLIMMFDVDPERMNASNKRPTDVFYRFLFTVLSDSIFTQTECNLTELTTPKLISKYKYKYSVIPLGFRPEDVQNEHHTGGKRYPRILAVGQISQIKGHDLLISIFAKIVNKFPNWELRIIGLSNDNNYMESLTKGIRDLGLYNSVRIFTDLSDDDLDREYEEASIFCLLSRNESFGIARVEAIYHGLPIVITEAGCGSQFKKFGSYVCKIDDQDCIIEALEMLIKDENLRKEVSERQMRAIMTWHEVALELSKYLGTR